MNTNLMGYSENFYLIWNDCIHIIKEFNIYYNTLEDVKNNIWYGY